MSAVTAQPHLVFPDSDGQPMADNTLQYEWMSLVKWNLEAYFRNRADVFVAGDNLIYPNPTDPTDRQAPDVYVAFGRPKGYRGSYKVWEEDGIFPQVIFEVWSPNNTVQEMDRKRLFYEGYGAEEFYILYPDHPMHAEGWLREDDTLVKVKEMNGFVSPRLGMVFDLKRGRLKVFDAAGREMKAPDEIARERDENARERDENARERDANARERDRATDERDAAARERDEAEVRARQQEERARLLADKLRELGIDPESLK